MTEQITKNDTAEAASVLTNLIESDQLSGAEGKALREALAVVWNVHERIMDEESK